MAMAEIIQGGVSSVDGGKKGQGGGGRRGLWIGLGLGLGLAAVLVAVSMGGQRPGGKQTSMPKGTEERAVRGSASAPVTVTMYSDFQCPYCAQADETLRRLDGEYVTTGKVKHVYKHYAFIGQESLWASEAAECAGDQGAFWSYHDKLFASQAGENKGAFGIRRLKGFARDLGLDEQKFSSCLDSHTYARKVREETEEGQRLGVRSTPTFFINGRKVEGAAPLDTFKNIIDEALKASQ